MALPSSIEFARHHDVLALLDGLAIGSFGAVDSVQLFSKVPPSADDQRGAHREERHLCLPAQGSLPRVGRAAGVRAAPPAAGRHAGRVRRPAAHRRRGALHPAGRRLSAEHRPRRGLAGDQRAADGLRRLRGAPRLRCGAPRRGGRPAGGADRLARPVRRPPARDGRRRRPRLRLQPGLPARVLRQAALRLRRRASARPGRVLPPCGCHRRAAATCPSVPRRPSAVADAARRAPAASPTPRRSSCCSAATCSSSGFGPTRLRRRLHPGDEVTFIVDRNINYTNVCVSGCRFCAFYREAGSPTPTCSREDEIDAKIEETLALGGTAVMMQGGLHPDLGIDWFERLFRGIKQRYPIHIHSLSPPEVAHIAERSGLGIAETLAAAAGRRPGQPARRRRRGPGRSRALAPSARTRSPPTCGWTSCARRTPSA